jgi:anti-anti-sigma factor
VEPTARDEPPGVVVHVGPACPPDGLDGPPVAVPAPRRSGGRHVAVVGEIDIETAPDLADLLHRHLDELVAGQTLVIDLDQVRHLAVAGVRVLERAAVVARERRVTLRISRASRQADRALRLCGLEHLGYDDL